MVSLKILIIQVAYPGDIYLISWLPHAFKTQYHDEVIIDAVVRKGYGTIMQKAGARKVFEINKTFPENLLDIARTIPELRNEKYDYLFNFHRYGSSAIISIFSGARFKATYENSYLSCLYTRTVPHKIGDGTHEIHRISMLVNSLLPIKPDYFPEKKRKKEKHIVIGPASRLNTKQPIPQFWQFIISKITSEFMDTTVYVIGSKDDLPYINRILNLLANCKNLVNTAGKITLDEAFHLISTSICYIGVDSAPLHIATLSNVPAIAVYCSTSPSLGFYPLSSRFLIIEPYYELACRPCGITGKKNCPLAHFLCGSSFKLPDVWRKIKTFISHLS